MKEINVRYECSNDEISSKALKEYENNLLDARRTLLSKTGLGKEYTGWVDYPLEIQEKDLEAIKEECNRLKKLAKCLVVIGIGGSYLGAKAAIDFLSSYYKENENEVIFLGNNVSPVYLKETLEYLQNKDFVVNVISKSGKTLEPALAFRFVRKLLEEKYGSLYSNYIVVTTSNENSLVHTEALENGYHEFFIPKTIGGRYSIFTAVGLLPICFSGFDIYELVKGAIICSQECIDLPYEENGALQYAAMRNLLYNQGKVVESLVSYEPKFRSLGEWWKQLFGESEGKDNKGIFPVSMIFSTDLHSLGQYVQDGIRNLFETVIEVKNDDIDLLVEKDDQNLDNLNYLTGKSVGYIRKQIIKGVSDAHKDGGVTNIFVTINDISEYSFGYLIYFFMFACGVSGYLLGVNPFNQEGVEAYKKNVSALLKK